MGRDDVTRRLRAVMLEASVKAVTSICQATIARAQVYLTESGRVDTGRLRGSLDYEVSVTASTSPQVFGVVFATVPYARWVEYGRRGTISSPPGTGVRSASAAMPPVSVIADWVRRKYKALAPAGRMRSGRARKPRADEVNRVAWAIARKIERYGIPPSPFLVPAFDEVSPRLRAMVMMETANMLSRVA
jgi:hypothetical protein